MCMRAGQSCSFQREVEERKWWRKGNTVSHSFFRCLCFLRLILYWHPDKTCGRSLWRYLNRKRLNIFKFKEDLDIIFHFPTMIHPCRQFGFSFVGFKIFFHSNLLRHYYKRGEQHLFFGKVYWNSWNSSLENDDAVEYIKFQFSQHQLLLILMVRVYFLMLLCIMKSK